MVRKISVAVITAALLLVVAATPAAARPTVVSEWEAVDIDGSNLSLIVYADGWTYSLDDDTSVCGGGMAKIYGPGTLDPHQNLTSVDWMVSCASGPLLGPYHVTFRTSSPPLGRDLDRTGDPECIATRHAPAQSGTSTASNDWCSSAGEGLGAEAAPCHEDGDR